MTGVVEGVGDPAEVFLSTTPVEDSGADTADRYEWQAAMAAVDILSVYLDWLAAGRPSGFEFRLVCEWHEDWALLHGTDVEIVSAKHREPGVGAITSYRELLEDGGVFHLLCSWLRLGRTPRCRLVTTTGLNNVLAELTSVCQDFRTNGVTDETVDRHGQVIDKVMRAVARKDATLLTDRRVTAAFLCGLTIDEGLPRRDHLPHYAPSGYAGPVAAQLGRQGAENAIWRAILAVVHERMRAGGPTGRAGLRPAGGADVGSDVAARTVTLNEIHETVSVALEFAGDYAETPQVIDPSNLGIKLTVGHLSANVVSQAVRLRRRYVAFRDAAADIPGERERFERAENALMRLVRDAERVAATGPPLWYELEDRVASLAGTDEFGGMDVDSLTGAIAELCEQCLVWFSDGFDVEERRRRLTTSGDLS